MADKTSQIEGEVDGQEFVCILPINLSSNSSVQKFENVQLIKREKCATASLPGSFTSTLDGALRPTRSQGDTPILGSEDIILPKWKSGPPTPVYANIFFFFLNYARCFCRFSCSEVCAGLGNGCERLCASRSLLGSYIHQESI